MKIRLQVQSVMEGIGRVMSFSIAFPPPTLFTSLRDGQFVGEELKKGELRAFKPLGELLLSNMLTSL